jgi:RNA polymerase-associated protein LEO1
LFAQPAYCFSQIYTMAIPNFLSLETEEFKPATYVAPPFATAATSICWRYAPDDPSRLQSNARVIRWEDGSMTLQLASNPREQYRIASKPLAPLNKSGQYEPGLDTHTYLAAAAETASVFRITSHLTHSLTVLPTDVETDDAVERLRESLAAAARAGKGDGGVTIIEVKEDPELASKRAELAEKEKLRADRRRQQLADREQSRTSRRGVYRHPAGGLTVGGLEDDDGMLTTRARVPKRARAKRRGEIYTDDEEEYDRRGRTREDEYDKDDGFLVGSDEEPEVMEDSEEEEELEDEDMDAEGEVDEDVQAEKPRPRKERKSASPKRKSPEAGGAGSPPTRKKHRYVVESDEDE